MNCKWAEGYLSACLDGTLDPAVRDEVEAHVGSCSHCSGILNDYRHFDALVRDLPRYEPAPELKSRLFNSPEFAEILRAQEPVRDDTDDRAPARHPASARPFLLSRPLSKGRGGAVAHDRPLTPLPFGPRGGDGNETPAPAAAPDETDHQPARIWPPAWTRTAVAAALMVVVFGSALLLWRGLSHSGTTSGPGSISNIGGYHGGTPLPVGSRVVYEHDGALWSAAEQGAGAAQRLTPAGVVVGSGWAVAPVRGHAGGDLVAYVDLKTGTLHVIRSDNQRDQVIGHALVPGPLASVAFWATPEGQAIQSSLTWSPDGSHLAALADPTGTGRLTLAVIGATGAGEQRLAATSVIGAIRPVWSADGARVAFAQASSSGQAIWDYNVAADQFKQVSVAAPDGPSNAVVWAMGWLANQGEPMLTWAAADPASGAITGIYAQAVQRDGTAQRYSPAGTTFTTAAFAASQEGGLWLLGDGSSLSSLAVTSDVLTWLAPVDGGVSAIVWSGDGTAATVLSGSGVLSIWSAAGLNAVAGGVAGQPGVVWSPDGQLLGFVANGRVNIAQVSGGAASGAPIVVLGLYSVTSLAWAPDGQQLAAVSPAGVTLVSADGASTRLVDAKGAAGVVVWSVVR